MLEPATHHFCFCSGSARRRKKRRWRSKTQSRNSASTVSLHRISVPSTSVELSVGFARFAGDCVPDEPERFAVFRGEGGTRT